ncbi:MAG: septation protein SepH [Actinomycetota bacterium]
MEDLRLVGVHDDGDHLVLADPQGERHLLTIDESLRAAVRRDRPHLGQLQVEGGEQIRPREIQARIRAGASPETVAEATGWPVQKIRRYEGPVLAERAHIADLAQTVPLRRRTREQVTLGQEVTRRLKDRDVSVDQVTWDSWREDGGPWMVMVSFAAGGRDRQAQWHFDITTRSVTPHDDEARWLSEQVPAPENHRYESTRDLLVTEEPHVYDVDLDGGVTMNDPLDLVSAMRTRRDGRKAEKTAPTITTTSSARSTSSRKESQETQRSSASAQARPTAGKQKTVTRRKTPSNRPASTPSRTDHATDENTAITEETNQVAKKTSAPSRSRRASVPHWDDIMFGTRATDEV